MVEGGRGEVKMCKSNDKIPLCWHCRWIVGIFFLAVLGMWGIICYTGKPEQGLEHWITVLIFLVTIVCTAIPLYMNNRYLELENKVKKQQDELGGKINHAIKEQQKLKDEIKKLFQETYSASTNIYLDIAIVLTKTFKDKIEEVVPDVINIIVIAIQYAIKTKDPDDIKPITDLIEFIHTIIKDKQDIRKDINKDSIDLLQILMQDDAIKNDKETYQKCIEIIYWVNEALKGDGKSSADGGK